MDDLFHIFFLGAEQPGWRDLLGEVGVTHLGMSYSSLQRRLPKKKAWTVADNFADGTVVLLDSGGHAANKKPESKTKGEWEAYGEEYGLFIEGNIDRLALVTEFDCRALGRRWIDQQRELFYDHLPREKFAPVWHPDQGTQMLDELAQRYPNIAVSPEGLNEARNAAATLNGVVLKYGTHLHGLAMTKPEEMRAIRFGSVSSTSWLSPMQYGDTIVWDGTRLRRYPVRYKEQARRRHKMLFERAGYDAEAILSDDPNEVARFTAWSWLQMEQSVQRRRNRPLDVVSGADADEEPFEDLASVTDLQDRAEGSNAEVAHRGVADPVPHERQALQLQRRDEDGYEPLPVLGVRQGEDGKVVKFVTGRAMRFCDSCYIADKCPRFKEGADCAYHLPVSVRSKEERIALLDGMIEMQTERIYEMRFFEQAQGGYADANLDQLMKRLTDLMKAKKEIEEEGAYLRMNLEARAAGGAMSRIFGDLGDTSQFKQLPPGEQMLPEDTDRILDAQLVDE